jgi:hypothetical protein
MKYKHICILIAIGLLLSIFFSSDCVVSGNVTACSELAYGYTPGTFDQYTATPTNQTPAGIWYDPSGLPISPQLLDRITDEVDTCLLTNGVTSKPIDRSSFVIKIASDWVYSCDTTSFGGEQELLPVDAPQGGCLAKGEVPDAICPCRWRAGIRCPNIIITPPNLYLYKDALIRFVLTITDPWGGPPLSVCATPTTNPLSNGTDPNNGLPGDTDPNGNYPLPDAGEDGN